MARYLLIPLAGLALVMVLLLNGGPLYYFDTGSYLAQGEAVLQGLGILQAPPTDQIPATDQIEAAPKGTAANAANGITGSRSVLYGITVAAMTHLAGITAALLPQLLAFLLALWCLAARLGLGRTPIALGLIAAGAGALPFYAAFLMPDLFAATMLLVLATILADRQPLGPAMALLTVGLGSLAAVTHLTHLGLVLGFLPLAVLAAVFRAVPRQAPLLIAAIFAIGISERFGFSIMAEYVEKREVVYTPFLTARLIADGPGSRYLDHVCAETAAADPACPLEARLDTMTPRPDRPARILFPREAEGGSFRHLPAETQAAIARDQAGFAIRVLAFEPFGVVWTVLQNTGAQLTHVSARQTLPRPEMLRTFATRPAGVPPILEDARLSANSPWVPTLDQSHRLVYGLSILILAATLVLPSAPPASRRMVFILGLGLLANAAICGALSEPAPRYGARVALLLPILAVWTLWLRQRSS